MPNEPMNLAGMVKDIHDKGFTVANPSIAAGFLDRESYSNVLSHMGRAGSISGSSGIGSQKDFSSLQFSVIFDRKLKDILFPALSRLEDLLRNAVFEGAHSYLGHGVGASEWLYDDKCFKSGITAVTDDGVLKMRTKLDTRVLSDPDPHGPYYRFRNSPGYATGNHLPSWKIKHCDEIKFVDLIKLISHVKDDLFSEISKHFPVQIRQGMSNPPNIIPFPRDVFVKWLTPMRTLRNKCAHSLPVFGWEPQRIFEPRGFFGFRGVPVQAHYRHIAVLRLLLSVVDPECSIRLKDELSLLQSAGHREAEAFLEMGFPTVWSSYPEWV